MNRVSLITAVLLCGCSDVIPFSGGVLTGTPAAAPADWTEAARPDVVQLETRPGDPYSVKLWVIGLGPALYVHAGANRATWVEHIDDNPDVRLLIGDALYELRAIRVNDPQEFEAFSNAYEIKYGRRPRNENVAEAYLFRLEARG
ncbi:MAG: hypothetical protein RIC56_22800 [Pseudomonadales bacterium]